MTFSELIGLSKNYSAHGGDVDHLIIVVHWFMLALFVGWTTFFFYCLFKFWRKRNPKASYHGVQSHLSSHMEVAVIIIEAALLLGFAFPLWNNQVDRWEEVKDMNPVRVRVVGWQFGWTYHYPGLDGKFGRVDAALMDGTNVLGIDYTDPNAHDDFIASGLKLPEQRPAVLNVGSKDVIHNYAIVPMRVQMDAIPGQENTMWFTPVETMETSVVCAQLCGEGHANMVGTMEVISQKDFDEWAKSQSETALEAHKKSQAVASFSVDKLY
jgi:cytochrome c oxidase subunit 2